MKKEELKKELEKLKDFKVYVFEGDVYVKAEDYKEKAIENRKLKDDLMEDMKEITKLEEENKKLNKYYDRDKEELMESCYSLAKERDELREENKKLNEKVKILELWLDNKEKLNKEYRKQIDKLKK